MPLGLTGFDKRALAGATVLVGIDEAGRGCLAGPVVAAAVLCRAEFYSTSWCRRHSRGVDDSKRLTPARRAEIVQRFREACHEKWIRIGIGSADIAEIERFNIYQANTLAMRRAVASLSDLSDLSGLSDLSDNSAMDQPVILIDGKPIRNFPLPHRGVVKGDRKSLAVALAGIHAKEWRDTRMREMDKAFPDYGFAVHKGYGTRQHLEAIRRLGPCPHHRRTFLRRILEVPDEAADATQCSLFEQ